MPYLCFDSEQLKNPNFCVGVFAFECDGKYRCLRKREDNQRNKAMDSLLQQGE
ncbi:hypothetical protein Rin_00006040, partial [Candidatus Regiella insecticola 5.15]